MAGKLVHTSCASSGLNIDTRLTTKPTRNDNLSIRTSFDPYEKQTYQTLHYTYLKYTFSALPTNISKQDAKKHSAITYL
jgi:hypothetical protein